MLAASLGQTTMAAAAPAAVVPPVVAPAPVPVPAAPSGMPVALERLAAYVPAVSCDTKGQAGQPQARCPAQGDVPGDDHRVLARGAGSDGLSTTEHYGTVARWTG